MQSAVKAFCVGSGRFRHKRRIVAQFRHDDGWARVHNEGPTDPILWLPNGELTQGHRFFCDRCSRDDYYQAPRIYGVLDKLRAEGQADVDVADIARAIK
jgi:hypothetical protein